MLHRAYVAGILDGEGTITAHKDSRVLVHLAVTERRLLEAFAASYGSVVLPMRRFADNPRARPMWQWRVWGDTAVAVCKDALPYLLLKRRQAELVVKLQRHRRAHPLTRGAFRRPEQDAENIAHRQRLVAELRVLNHRGVRA